MSESFREPPASLGDAGRLTWADTAELLGESLRSEAERVALLSFCAATDRAAQARAQIEAEGVLVMDHRGNAKKHPMLEVERTALAEVGRGLKRYRRVVPESGLQTEAQFAAALGLAPSKAHKWLACDVLRRGMSAHEATLALQRARAGELTGTEAAEADSLAADRIETTKLKAARRAKVELEIERAAGKLVPLADVGERWLRMSARWASVMRSIPARYDAQLADFAGHPPEDARRWLQKMIDAVLLEAQIND